MQNEHGHQHKNGEKGVHSTDVVEHVLISKDNTHHDAQKVQTKQHLNCSSGGEALPLAIQDEIAVSCHPYVGCYVNTDCVIYLLLIKVMVPEHWKSRKRNKMKPGTLDTVYFCKSSCIRNMICIQPFHSSVCSRESGLESSVFLIVSKATPSIKTQRPQKYLGSRSLGTSTRTSVRSQR